MQDTFIEQVKNRKKMDIGNKKIPDRHLHWMLLLFSSKCAQCEFFKKLRNRRASISIKVMKAHVNASNMRTNPPVVEVMKSSCSQKK